MDEYGACRPDCSPALTPVSRILKETDRPGTFLGATSWGLPEVLPELGTLIEAVTEAARVTLR